MKKSFLQKAVALLLCVVMVTGPAAPVMAEDITIIDEIVQMSDVGEILVFGGENIIPTCWTQGDIPVVPDSEYTCWYRYDERTEEWNYYSYDVFLDGLYYFDQRLILDDDTGMVQISQDVAISIDGVECREIIVDETSVYLISGEYVLEAPDDSEVIFLDDWEYDIYGVALHETIEGIDVSYGVGGGTAPYTFSKVSGPEWVNVSEDGIISGTVDEPAREDILVVRVTDSAGKYAEIEVDVCAVYGERTEITQVVATTDAEDILGCGNDRVLPTFTIDNEYVYFEEDFTDWYRYDEESDTWEIYRKSKFEEGTYRYHFRYWIKDEYVMDYALSETVATTIDGFDCTFVSVGTDSTACYAYSKEYVVTKPKELRYDADSGKWYYYVGDEPDNTYTGIVEYGGATWYVINGVLDSGYTGIRYDGTDFWYVVNGKVNTGFVGLYKYADAWWYIKDGKIQTSYKGMIDYSGYTWYVATGKVDVTFTGLGLHNGVWYCVQAGKVNMSYSGLVLNGGSWWYVTDGVLDTSVTGIVETGGSEWLVATGKLQSGYTGTYLYQGLTYTIVNGKVTGVN